MLFFEPLAGHEEWTQVTCLPLPPLLLIVLWGGIGVREEGGQGSITQYSSFWGQAEILPSVGIVPWGGPGGISFCLRTKIGAPWEALLFGPSLSERLSSSDIRASWAVSYVAPVSGKGTSAPLRRRKLKSPRPINTKIRGSECASESEGGSR